MIIETDSIWDGKLYKLRYTDVDNFDDLPIEQCKQIYGVCFYKDKMVIAFNSELNSWSFVGGSIKKGETFKEALEREILEETNMKMLEFQPIAYQTAVSQEGEMIYQLRACCIVEPLGPWKGDASGAITEIKLIDPKDYKKYFYWGRISDRMVEQAMMIKEKLV